MSNSNSVVAGDKAVKVHLWNGTKTACNRKALTTEEMSGFKWTYEKFPEACCVRCLEVYKTRATHKLITRLQTLISKMKSNSNFGDDDEQNAIFDEITSLGIFNWEESNNAQAYFEKATPIEICEYALDRVRNGGRIPAKYEDYGNN